MKPCNRCARVRLAVVVALCAVGVVGCATLERERLKHACRDRESCIDYQVEMYMKAVKSKAALG